MKVNIRSIHFTADGKLVDFVQERMDKLHHFYDGIIGGEVFLRLEKSENKENKVSEIKIKMPGKELFAKCQCRTFEEATDNATEALIKQIKKQKDKIKR